MYKYYPADMRKIGSCFQKIIFEQHQHYRQKIDKNFYIDEQNSNIDSLIESDFGDHFVTQQVYACVLTNVTIVKKPNNLSRYWFVLHDDKYFINFVSSYCIDTYKKSYNWSFDDDKTLTMPTNSHDIIIKKQSVFLPIFHNLEHFYKETLPSLKILKNMGVNFEKIIFLVNTTSAVQKYFFHLLKIPEYNIINISNMNVKACQIIIPCFGTFGHLEYPTRFFKESITWIKKVRKREYVCGGESKIYISRSDATQRKIINEHILFKYLEKNNFKIIIPTNFSINQQIDIFENATQIVGPHGMGLANVCFSEENSVFCEIMSPFWIRNYFYRTAQLYNFKYHCYFSNNNIHEIYSDELKKHGNFCVNERKLEEIFDSLDRHSEI